MAQTIKVIIFFSLGCLLLAGCSSNLPDAVETAYNRLPEEIDFNFHVRPIISDRCFKCHGPDEKARKADLRFDLEESAFSKIKDKETFPIIPGNPLESALVERILSHDPDFAMPPPESKLALTDEERAILVKWIEQGAKWKKHWAFIPPEKVGLPEVKNKSWVRNEIDYFVLNKLEDLGFQPSEEANKETLIRRLSFDLTGLPPTPDEVNKFKLDKSANAYEKLVDRLLASPKYGERWTWEWLDVARYSDTNGFQGDPTRNMWPWRDWVINAFNNNMPYNEFTIKQLAGDLLSNATKEDILATGFNRNHTYNGEGGRISEETRVENVFDRVETVGTVWMGLTLNCTRCHDHKFDALKQKEYYQLFDYFNQISEEGNVGSGSTPPVLDVSPIEDAQRADELKEFLIEISGKVDEFETVKFPREPGLPASKSDEAEKIPEAIVGVLENKPIKRNPSQLLLLQDYYVKPDSRFAALLNKLRAAKINYEDQKSKNILVMVMDEVEEPRQTFVLQRGTYSKPLDSAFRNVPAVLPALPEGIKNDRLALAKWLVAKEHPLTARVTVNRYWQAFFGNGLVKTIEDFGVQGALPTHPELLDWLSTDFQDNGWNLKALFKKIVMSATYRQSSKVSEESLENDPENKYLSRATRMRWPSWMLRDQALFISGLLVDSLGGKPVKPYQPPGIWEEATFGFIKYEQDHGDALYRRTLYTFWRRIVGPTMLFDNSARQVCSVNMMKTNTPLHALTTLNDVTYMEAARVLAERVLNDRDSDKSRLEYVFELATSRKPKSEEIKILENRLKELRKEYDGSEEEAKKITLIGEFQVNENLDRTDYAAYTVLSSLVLNLDETITRQ
ncbi:MAG: PSD1 and planctomycete cytochrome C domain-containing protein [Bacteroidetes bacterium]|nr:PSD1 and planctomycete cytochrome C domain-containing protein [Bacteroidota bacterium]MDA1119775.1 PSD1 and planctomycete cytochrome C domain-containing protein [Bacteroidota bacterium]